MFFWICRFNYSLLHWGPFHVSRCITGCTLLPNRLVGFHLFFVFKCYIIIFLRFPSFSLGVSDASLISPVFFLCIWFILISAFPNLWGILAGQNCWGSLCHLPRENACSNFALLQTHILWRLCIGMVSLFACCYSKT